MTEVVERVARAIYEAQVPWRTGTADSDVNPFARASYDLADERMREHLRIMAAAAIAAMREPTGGMQDAGSAIVVVVKVRKVEAGFNGPITLASPCDGLGAATIWSAMVDAALVTE